MICSGGCVCQSIKYRLLHVFSGGCVRFSGGLVPGPPPSRPLPGLVTTVGLCQPFTAPHPPPLLPPAPLTYSMLHFNHTFTAIVVTTEQRLYPELHHFVRLMAAIHSKPKHIM